MNTTLQLNIRIMKKLIALSIIIALSFTSCTIDCFCPEPDPSLEVNFETFLLPTKGYMDAELNGSFKQGGVTFYSNWVPEFGGYSNGGIYLSNLHDRYTVGFQNQYSTVASSSDQFAVVHYSAYVAENEKNWACFSFDKAVRLESLRISNSTYAYWSMRTGEDGIGACRPYKEGDWFRVIFTAFDADENRIGSIAHYLADFRENNMYVSEEWEYVYLGSLGDNVMRVEISIEGTDMGEYGLNTPTYCCIDNITYTYKE